MIHAFLCHLFCFLSLFFRLISFVVYVSLFWCFWFLLLILTVLNLCDIKFRFWSVCSVSSVQFLLRQYLLPLHPLWPVLPVSSQVFVITPSLVLPVCRFPVHALFPEIIYECHLVFAPICLLRLIILVSTFFCYTSIFLLFIKIILVPSSFPNYLSSPLGSISSTNMTT